ncbi:MAG: DUF1592 domain-containing protein [Planctomycetales bacterium]|nr:DUF1592 domain-containing protein [Planctomycetales bacterium]
MSSALSISIGPRHRPWHMALFAVTAAIAVRAWSDVPSRADEPAPVASADAAADGEAPAGGDAPANDNAAVEAATAEDFFAESLQPLIAAHCLSCHSGDDAEAGISLDAYADVEAMRAARETWQRVARALGDGIMPPKDEPRPEHDHVTRTVAWITTELDRVDCSQGVDPGQVTIHRLNRVEYNNTIRDLTGLDVSPADDFPSDDVGYGFDNMADVLSLPPVLLEKYLAAAETVAQAAVIDPDDADSPAAAMADTVADAEVHAGIMAVSDTSAADAVRAEEILRRFATRAFRRPVDEETLDQLVGIAEATTAADASFERGIQVAIQAVLVSPRFLFRLELDPTDVEPGSIYRIDAYDLAARLSYFLWSTMPDEQLFAAAADGSLHDPTVYASQVRRLLADERSQALVDNFAMQWLQLRKLDTVQPDRERFPAFDDELREAMWQETRMYVTSIVREDRNLLELIDSDYTFVNEALAAHYGIPGVAGSTMRRVSVDAAQRGGVLTQASVLTVTSNPTRTSPVKRGRWVLEQILGTPPPPPPADVPPLEESAQLTGTLRERLEQHRADPSCASCHKLMDPPGFGLENYDAVGGWRTTDGDDPIDASGEMSDGETFSGPAGLKRLLLGKKELFLRAISEKMLTYALGRGLEYYDRCAVDEIAAAVNNDPEHRFSTLILAIAHNDAFQKRRARGAEDD